MAQLSCAILLGCATEMRVVLSSNKSLHLYNRCRFPLITLFILLNLGCRKDNTGNDVSHWTFKGINYSGIKTTNDTTENGILAEVLASSASSTDDLRIFFWSRPDKNSSFTVNNGTLPQPIPGTCTILLHHAEKIFISRGLNGEEINLTLSGSGIRADFNHIEMMANDTSFETTTVSGTLLKN